MRSFTQGCHPGSVSTSVAPSVILHGERDFCCQPPASVWLSTVNNSACIGPPGSCPNEHSSKSCCPQPSDQVAWAQRPCARALWRMPQLQGFSRAFMPVCHMQSAKHPMMVIGAGANRKLTCNMLRQFVTRHRMPFCDTQMGKGVIDSSKLQLPGPPHEPRLPVNQPHAIGAACSSESMAGTFHGLVMPCAMWFCPSFGHVKSAWALHQSAA